MSYRAWGILCCALFFAGSAAAQPPVEAFGRLPVFSDPELSPDGKHVAAIQSFRGQPVVVIYDMTAPPHTKPAIVGGSDDWILADVEWAKNDRLAVIMKKGAEVHGDDRMYTWVREVTVSVTGTDPAVLNQNQEMFYNTVSTSGIIDRNLDDADNVFIPFFTAGISGDTHLSVLSVDVRTGHSSKFMNGNDDTSQWFMDGHGHVVARVDESRDPLVDHLKFYDGNDWDDAGDFDATGDKGVGLVGLTDDGKNAAFVEWNDKGMQGLYARPLSGSGQATQLFSNPDYDLSGTLRDEWTGRVVGATYVDDRERYVYFDPALAALQRGLDQAIPNLSVHAVSTDLTRQHVMAEADSPQQPPLYFYLDRTTHQAIEFASTYPELSAQDLGEMKSYPYRARDGLDIHAYLTIPPGSTGKNLPLVVMPHGGPRDRDSLSFDWMGQFFANRGYAVFQPNFRGSTGYGHKFVEAGYGEWGRKMQDDITDGVQKLIADGVVDPKRICIVGASYGGYAALAGAAFTPDLYACAVSFAGISDLSHMMSAERRDSGSESGAFSDLTLLLGSDTDKLRATSPARHADQVKCPVLLMHGENDTTVPIIQSELMSDALKDAGKDVQFIKFRGEDHYFNFADTRIRFLTEVEKFLVAHIGPDVTANNNK